MLVLTRSVNKSIIIGEGKDAVEVTLLEIRDNHVRLGFTGNVNIPVHRAEIYEKIHGVLPQPRPKLYK